MVDTESNPRPPTRTSPQNETPMLNMHRPDNGVLLLPFFPLGLQPPKQLYPAKTNGPPVAKHICTSLTPIVPNYPPGNAQFSETAPIPRQELLKQPVYRRHGLRLPATSVLG